MSCFYLSLILFLHEKVSNLKELKQTPLVYESEQAGKVKHFAKAGSVIKPIKELTKKESLLDILSMINNKETLMITSRRASFDSFFDEDKAFREKQISSKSSSLEFSPIKRKPIVQILPYTKEEIIFLHGTLGKACQSNETYYKKKLFFFARPTAPVFDSNLVGVASVEESQKDSKLTTLAKNKNRIFVKKEGTFESIAQTAAVERNTINQKIENKINKINETSMRKSMQSLFLTRQDFRPQYCSLKRCSIRNYSVARRFAVD